MTRLRIACAAGVLLLAGCGSHPAAAPSPSTPPPSTSLSSPVATTTTTSPPPTSSAPPPLVGAPLAFAWTAQVRGLTVTVGGSWSGTDQTLTAAQVAGDHEISSGARAGSGVLAYNATVLTREGKPVPPGTAPAEADFTAGVYSTDGDVPTCTGPATAQSRGIASTQLTFAEPGTYLLSMRTTSCAGSRTDTKVVTVG